MFCFVDSIFLTAASLRLLYLVIPAASSRYWRLSSGLASMRFAMLPCSTSEYVRAPTPVSMKNSFTSSRRQRTLLMEYSPSSSRKTLRVIIASEQSPRWGRERIPGGLHDERHLGHAHRLRLFAAVEDDVIHLFPAQQRHPLFAHDPADGVYDVALSAPVGPHDAADARREIDDGSVPEGLESDDLEPLEFHSIPMLLSV